MPILTDQERIGTTVAGKYKIEKLLGKGGMGVVFAGTHEYTGRSVALKLLKPDYAAEPQLVSRFLQEARTAAKIKHPNVVDVLDMGHDDDGTVYLVLERLHGRPLTDVLDRVGTLSAQVALDLLLPVMDALADAHRHGIVHRDIKPDNVFVSRGAKGQIVPKILDFGIAKVVDAEKKSSTRTGTVIGTPHYMAPEQAGGRSDVGPWSDVWSMGVVFHEVLTGELPYKAESATAVLVAIVSMDPPSIGAVRPDLPARIVRAIDGALVRSKSERYANMGEFHAALVAAAEECGLAQRQPIVLPVESVLPPGPAARSGVPSEESTAETREAKVVPPAARARRAAAREESDPYAATVGAASTPDVGTVGPVTTSSRVTRSRGTRVWLAVGAVALAVLVAGGLWATRGAPERSNAGSTPTRVAPPPAAPAEPAPEVAPGALPPTPLPAPTPPPQPAPAEVRPAPPGAPGSTPIAEPSEPAERRPRRPRAPSEPELPAPPAERPTPPARPPAEQGANGAAIID